MMNHDNPYEELVLDQILYVRSLATGCSKVSLYNVPSCGSDETGNMMNFVIARSMVTRVLYWK